MAPIQVKPKVPSPPAVAAAALPSSRQQQAMLLRETLRLSAGIASSSDTAGCDCSCSSSSLPSQSHASFEKAPGNVLCWEIVDGQRYNYLNDRLLLQPLRSNTCRNPFQDILMFIRSCIFPDGYPDSVTSSYMPYMQWRALKYFFGGAMGVFTTRSLLHAVGVSGKGATSSAVAVNWVLKDGAGRIGKMLFARQGKKFDCELKQLRFRGDLLMEIGAGVELATMAAPHLFLPFACAANVAKNVAAVTSTSTRSHIYKAFAKGENIGDVTAKGECISNVADLLGTGLSILLSKQNPSLLPTFAVLSFGYVFCSYQEVKSLVLNSLNRSRFATAAESFFKTGQVPSLQEGNLKETIFPVPWSNKRDIVLGARVNEAFEDSKSFLSVGKMFEKERYIVTFNLRKARVYALLRDKASSDDVLKAAFHAHLLLHVLTASKKVASSRNSSELGVSRMQYFPAASAVLSSDDVQAGIAESCQQVSLLFEKFKKRAYGKGWVMAESLINPGSARLCG